MNISTIEQGEELLSGVTPGKWQPEGYGITSGEYKAFTTCRSHTDTEFICWARNHASELLQIAREVKKIRSEGLSVYSKALEETVVRLAHGPLPTGVTDDAKVPFRQGWEMACSAILTLCLPRLEKR